MTKKKQDVEEVTDNNVSTDTEEPQFTVIDNRDMPMVLKSLISISNDPLQSTQTRLMNEITESANELMAMVGLNPEEGWVVDVAGLKFLQVAPLDSTTEEESV